MMVLDLIICFALTLFGFALGMDKAHNFLDFIGPTMLLAAAIYAAVSGLIYIAIAIVILFLFKIIIR